MKNHSYISMQQDMPDQGQLQVTVLDSASNRPVENATVRISYTGVPDNVIEEIRTDSSGKTPMLELSLIHICKPGSDEPSSSSCTGWRKAGISGGRSDPEKTGKPSGRRHDPFCGADAFDGVDGYRYV